MSGCARVIAPVVVFRHNPDAKQTVAGTIAQPLNAPDLTSMWELLSVSKPREICSKIVTAVCYTDRGCLSKSFLVFPNLQMLATLRLVYTEQHVASISSNAITDQCVHNFMSWSRVLWHSYHNYLRPSHGISSKPLSRAATELFWVTATSFSCCQTSYFPWALNLSSDSPRKGGDHDALCTKAGTCKWNAVLSLLGC